MIINDLMSQFFSDEKGKPSAARMLLSACLLFTAVLIVFDSMLWGNVSGEVYSLLSVVFTGLLAWCAGPRISQYILPQIGAIAAGVSAAIVREPRRPEILDSDPRFHDEEG
jgi:hypothetical protein